MAKRAVRCGWAAPADVLRGAETCHSLATGPASQVACTPALSNSSAEALYLTPFTVADTEVLKPAASICAGSTAAAVVGVAFLASDMVRVALAAMVGMMVDSTA